MPESGDAFSASREEQARLLALTEELAPNKINVSANVLVASVPAGNPHPEESPVDEHDLPQITTNVTLTLSVPQHAVGPTVARLSATLAAAVQEATEDGFVGAASLSLYPVVNDDEDGGQE